MKKSLTNIEHLKRRDDISRLFKYGKRASDGVLAVRCIKNDYENKPSRFIVIPQRNFGLAVERNLIRRRINQICRLNQNEVVHSFDIAIFAKKDALYFSYKTLENRIIDLFSQLGLKKLL